jgi:hypothetical protein
VVDFDDDVCEGCWREPYFLVGRDLSEVAARWVWLERSCLGYGKFTLRKYSRGCAAVRDGAYGLSYLESM